jgi:hypothetical protein
MSASPSSHHRSRTRMPRTQAIQKAAGRAAPQRMKWPTNTQFANDASAATAAAPTGDRRANSTGNVIGIAARPASTLPCGSLRSRWTCTSVKTPADKISPAMMFAKPNRRMPPPAGPL